jgi:tetratricopeptide (TPR) repeat protein
MAGDTVAAAVMQLSLGHIALHEGAYPRARAAFLTCVPVLRTIGWGSIGANGLVGLADVAREQGDIEEAASLYAEALALYRQAGEQHAPTVTWVHCRLARMYVEHGDWTRARTYATQALIIARDTGQVEAGDIVDALEVYATLAAQAASPRSVHLTGAVATLRRVHGLPAADGHNAHRRSVTYLPRPSRAPEVFYRETQPDRGSAPAEQAVLLDEQAVLSLEEAIALALAESGWNGST